MGKKRIVCVSYVPGSDEGFQLGLLVHHVTHVALCWIPPYDVDGYADERYGGPPRDSAAVVYAGDGVRCQVHEVAEAFEVNMSFCGWCRE